MGVQQSPESIPYDEHMKVCAERFDLQQKLELAEQHKINGKLLEESEAKVDALQKRLARQNRMINIFIWSIGLLGLVASLFGG